MKHPDSLILYVEDPAVSAAFYHGLFGAPIVEASPNFAMLALAGGTMLGLWAQRDVSPAPSGGPGGLEIGVTVGSATDTDAAYAQAQALGAAIHQAPVTLDFGYTFVLQSPDGHLIRVFNPA